MFNERVQFGGEVESKPSVRDAQREATALRVLDAAARRFDEVGFDAATIREIAAEAGVSVGTVMGVGDKATLLVAVFDREIDVAGVRERARRAARREDAPREVVDGVVAVVAPYLELFASRIDLARAYSAVLVSGRGDAEVLGRLAAELVEDFAVVLRASGAIDPKGLAGALYLAYMGALFVGAASGDAELSRVAGAFRAAATAILGGTTTDPVDERRGAEA